MKSIAISIAFLLFVVSAYSQNNADLWSIKFYTVDSFKVDMNYYKGKTIIIATIDASNPNRSQLLYLDSLNRDTSSAVGVIGIFINDFGKAKKREVLLDIIRQGNGLSFPITDVVKIKKSRECADKIQALLCNTCVHTYRCEANDQNYFYAISHKNDFISIIFFI